MPNYAIVYATDSKALRRVIADDEREFAPQTERRRFGDVDREALVLRHRGRANDAPSYHALHPGESAIIVEHESDANHDQYDWMQIIADETGVYPPDLTCALLDQNNLVRDIIHADPAIDASPDGSAMVACYSPQIVIGCTYDPYTGLFTHPGGNPLPPHSAGNPTDEPIDVPPFVIPKP